MMRCVWQALNPLSIHVTYTEIFPGAYPGKPKCVLDSLDVAICLHPQNGEGINDIVATVSVYAADGRSVCDS